jgi:hypothetical protein
MKLLYLFMLLGLTQALVGCASFSTVMLNRSEDNTSWQKEKFLRGVPITLKVPTHLRIDVLEKHYLIAETSSKSGVVHNPVVRSKAPFPIRAVAYTSIETEKIFLVDLKRPGAGTINAEIDFDPDSQYFKSIKSEVEDETIKAIGDLIAAVAPGGLFGAPTSEGVGSELTGIKEIQSVVASQVFEVDAPDFEMQVMAFLNHHLNCCHDCGIVQPGNLAPWVLPSRAEYPEASRKVVKWGKSPEEVDAPARNSLPTLNGPPPLNTPPGDEAIPAPMSNRYPRTHAPGVAERRPA